MFYTLEIYKKDRRLKSGVRLVGKYDYDRPDLASMEREVKELTRSTYTKADGYILKIEETYITSKNLLSGEEFHQRYDTPHCCDPSSETYWSM